jgi:midasin
LLNSVLQFWWDTYHLATSPSYEEAIFQAHLAIGNDLFTAISETMLTTDKQYPIIEDLQSNLKAYFDSGFKLTTGLSMELLWKRLRPTAISKQAVMHTLLQMEHLAVRFDALRWKASISVEELGGVMTSLVQAYKLVLTSDVDGHSLVQTLNTELEKLEASIGSEDTSIKPFLEDQFESLRQFQLLETMQMLPHESTSEISDVDTIVLANYSTTSNFRESAASETSTLFQGIDSLWGSGNGLQPIMTTFSENLLHRLNAVGEVDLRSLKLLESELPIMGQKLAASTRSLGHDQILLLNHTLSELIAAVINFHGIRNVNCLEISHRFESSLPKSRLQNSGFSILNECASDFEFGPAHLANVLDTNFRVAFIAVEASKRDPETRFQYSALAWVQFAVGAITLYVPDRTFDPDKKQRIARERHVAMSETLKNRLFALKEFEQLFTNQSSNLRCQLLKQEISELGEPAEVLQEIYRPEVSEMDQLQGEFKNLLKTIVYSNPYQKLLEHFTNGDVNDLQEITLMQNNVLQIVRRLTERFREYSDLIVPVVNILRCMQIGLSLAALASKSPESNSDTRLALSRMTPFLGGHPLVINESLISSQPMEFLGLVATTSAIEPVSSFDPSLKQALMKAFHGCYEQWSKRLEFDRQDQESKSGLYRFRGSAEDEEEGDVEQFNELFPAYDDDSEPQVNEIHNPHTARDTAVRLSNVHSSIFLGGTTPSESMLALIRQVSHKIGALHNDEAHFDQNNMSSALLPGALLILDDHAASLSSSATISENYNFYADANLPETRKLVSLIHQIQSRFRELKAVDEIGHMQPLEDVLVSCQELLQFRHTEPLAKIITKVEKVHTFIHEWQFGGWASRANSALTLYDNITSTIVNWRRLELSTWAKLFDMETSKCDDDAKSWWFVAYQVVVAAPLSNSDSIEELKSYAQKLLKDLETYFSTAIMGQFVQRLRLLKQLQKHLEVIALEVPSMSIIHGAVANFIALYARYEKPVQENLKRGRVTLEKAMRDVLLLASWKDANIVALRDSAKRSHHKLFKIVRKFRSLLGQPMEFVLKAGLPDETLADSDGSNYTAPALFPTVDLSALALCARTVPNWPEKSKRFINVSKTVSIMADAGRVPESAVEGSAYLDSFLANIITSTAELQKATPSILTDDNKMKVKHLKSQKRKLFADTLKDLRQMGIKYNLGANALSKQDSLSIVLASVEPLNIINQSKLYGLEYYFHKSVDLAPRARAAAQQHSEDLSSAEVARSTGFLEGLVQVILSQRNTLSSAVTGMSRLDSSLRMARALWAPEAYGIRNSHQTSNQKDILCWLPNILIVCLELIKTHAKLGNFDNTLALDFVTEWMGIFDDYAKHSNDLPTLPSHIISTKMQKLEGDFAASIHLFSTRLVEFSKEHPDLSFILDQVMPWIKIKSTEISDGAPPQTISILDQKLSTICDAVFVAIEKYKNTLKDLPASTEEPNWLVQYDTCLSNSIKFLHCPTITSQVEDAFKILRRVLSSGEHSSEAGAVFAVALPILQQYSNILQEAVSRYAQLHRATCKTSFVLAKTFTQIASQGFCTPSEKQDAQDGKTEKLEGGTGLGEGEGAEDISKDIQDDENLDELAQEPDASNKEDMEDEKDAVDMADGEMEGEMQDGDNKGDDDEGSGDEEDGEDMDDEAGDVDDLDPNAIDEKMWDGDGKEPEKDQEGDESKGKQNKDEQVAAQENDKEAPEGGENSEEEEVGAEQGEEITQQDEVEKHDPHAQEGDALDLPEDMELDGDEEEGSEGSDNGMDNLSDVEDVKEGEQINDGNDEPEAESMDPQEDQNMEDEMDIVDLDEENEDGGEKTEEAGENTEETPEEQAEDQEGLLQDKSDDASADPDNAVPSNVQGIGEDQDDNATDDKNESSSRAQRDDGGEGGDSSEQKESAAEDGEKGRQADGDAPQDSKDETQDSANAQPFKKLGDALESWHRQQTQIREAPESREQGQDQNMDMNVESSEFQHLQDEDAEADTQAMGTATEEQAHALDESMAVDPENNELPDQFQADDADEKETERDDVMDLEDPSTPQEQIPSDAYEGRVGASINQAKQDRNEDLDEPQSHGQANLEEDVEEVDRELESTHLVNPEEVDFRSAADARLQWTHYEAQTRDLSLSLTEQLRLILAPTLATKMRGDFRTGKRLNIKRIIPYIASQYKRDKIWMRRSVPSKRSYQIMLAVDDSKSMGESGSGSLAFETLVMVSKSLSMLEVGEICVVGFGEDVRVAHDFDTPFSSDAGPKVFQNFAFEQKRTDVTKLVRESIELFRSARAKASSSPTDLWQMELIISDGVCDSSEHEPIRRLLREALEERIMMVFVIVDDVRNKKKGESVMDLKEAKFVKDEMTGASNVKIERYLDTFPFQYYLIVSDVKELPGVLATLLRQWFAEVVDSSN